MVEEKEQFNYEQSMKDLKLLEKEADSPDLILSNDKKTSKWSLFVIPFLLLLCFGMFGYIVYSPSTQYINQTVVQSGAVMDVSLIQNVSETNKLLKSENQQLLSAIEDLRKQILSTPTSANISDVKLNFELATTQKINEELITTISNLQNQINNLSEQKTVILQPPTTQTYLEIPSSSYIDFSAEQTIDRFITTNTFPKLKEDILSFRSRSIGYQEMVHLKDLVPTFTSSVNVDEDFGTSLALTNERGSIEYLVRFDEPIFLSEIDEDHLLKFNWLGSVVEISSAKVNGITLSSGERKDIMKGETVTIENVKVNLLDTTDTKAVFRIDGELVILGQDESKTTHGIDIKLKSVVNSVDLKLAQIIVGDKVNKEILNGDKYESNGNYTWIVHTDGAALTEIGLKYDQRHSEKNDVIFKEGNIFTFESYFGMKPSWNNEPKYAGFNIDFERFGQNNIPALRLRSLDGNKILVDNILINELWIKDTTLFYLTTNNQEVVTHSNATIVTGDVNLPIQLSNGIVQIGKYTLQTDGTKLGVVKNQDEAAEINYAGNQIGLRQKIMSPDGVQLLKNENDDKISLNIPTRRLDLRLSFS